MSARPRPVTATVTKPPWMCVPKADAAMYRRSSLTSNGSTASLTSVLDHDSYISEPDSEEETVAGHSEEPMMTGDAGGTEIKSSTHYPYHPTQPRKLVRHTAETAMVEDNGNLRRYNSSESGLSAWEIWLIKKAQEVRKFSRQTRPQRRQEKLDQMAKDREKLMKAEKVQEKRTEWLQKKRMEDKLNKKMEKLRLENEKHSKEENERRLRCKTESKFSEWAENKREEERKRKQNEKQQKLQEEKAQVERQKMAEERYQEWLRSNKTRPKSAPAERSGYNNNAPYPRPGYVNPIPWQHPAVPKVKQDKPKKPRPRKYVWNPDKYF